MSEPTEFDVLHTEKPDIALLKKQQAVFPKDRQHTQWGKLMTFAGIASTLGSAVPAGYCIGVMNSPAANMRSWCNETLIRRYELHLSSDAIEILWSAIVSIFLIGGAIGSVGGAWAANKFGRKGTLIICGGFFAIASILFFVCRLVHSVETLIIARFVVGLASGLTTASLPMYLIEIAPLELRGTFGVFCPVGLTAGVVVGQVFSLQTIFGAAERWHFAMSFYVILVIIFYAPICYYPESPKWLYVVRQRPQLARKQLERLRGAENKHVIEKELQEMEVEANVKEQSSSFADVLKDSKLLLPLVIVCAYQAGQQLSGINAIFFYSVSIFRRAGLSTAAAESVNLGAGSLNLAISLLGPVLMAKCNRRSLMLFSTFFCSLALLSFSMMLYFIDSVDWFAMGCIACIFLYIFVFQFGVGPIPLFIGSELFEVSPRPVAMSMGSLFSWSINVVIGMTFPSLQNAWGSLVFLPCSIACALLFVLTMMYLPETRGRDPSVVAPLMAKGFKSFVH